MSLGFLAISVGKGSDNLLHFNQLLLQLHLKGEPSLLVKRGVAEHLNALHKNERAIEVRYR